MSFVREAVSKAIVRGLRAYLAHIEQESVSMGLWDGDLALEDVELKIAAFNSEECPFAITHGAIQSIRIQVPWKTFWKDEIRVEIGGVDIEVQSKGFHDVEKELHEKNRKVQEMHSVAISSASWTSWLTGGLSSSITERMWKNVHLEISNIHIYYVTPGIRIGMNLDGLQWKNHEAFHEKLQVFTIKSIAIYAEEDVKEAAYWVLPLVYLHATIRQEVSGFDVQCHCTSVDITIPSSLLKVYTHYVQSTACYENGVRFKCKRWQHLHGKSKIPRTKALWKFAISNVRSLLRPTPKKSTISTSQMECYVHLYSLWLELMRSRNAKALRLVSQLSFYELQMTTLEIYECQQQAKYLAQRHHDEPAATVQIESPPEIQVTITWLLDNVSLNIHVGDINMVNTWHQISGTGQIQLVGMRISNVELECEVQKNGALLHQLNTDIIHVSLSDWYLSVNGMKYHHRVGESIASIRHQSSLIPLLQLRNFDAVCAVAHDCSMKCDVVMIQWFVSSRLLELLKQCTSSPSNAEDEVAYPVPFIANFTCQEASCIFLLPSIGNVNCWPARDCNGEATLAQVDATSIQYAIWSQSAEYRSDLSLGSVTVSLLQKEILKISPCKDKTQALSIMSQDYRPANHRQSFTLYSGDFKCSFYPELICDALSQISNYSMGLQNLSPPSTVGGPPSSVTRFIQLNQEQTTVMCYQRDLPFVKIALHQVESTILNGIVHIKAKILDVQDLTKYGNVHQHFIMPTECHCGAPCYMLDITLKEDLAIDLHAIQFTCLYRFYLEVWNYMYESSGGILPVLNAISTYFPADDTNSYKQCKSLIMRQVAFIIPRNSESEDRLALVMDKCTLQRSFVNSTWSFDAPPQTTENADRNGTIQRDGLHMYSMSILCADTQEISERFWSFQYGTTSETRPGSLPVAKHNISKSPLVRANTRVYGATQADLQWVLVTLDPTDLIFMRDTFAAGVAIQTRDLYVFQPNLRLEMDVTEWSLLLSIWYDNMGEYVKFPTPFIQTQPFTQPYESGPHPDHAPFENLSQLPVDQYVYTWEVGLICHLWELQIELKESDETVKLSFSSVTGMVKGSDNTTFLRSTIAASHVQFTKMSPKFPPVVLAEVASSTNSDEVDIYFPFRSENQPKHAFQFSSIRFPYGYTMMAITFGGTQVSLFDFPEVLAFVIEYFSTFFYDPEFGYPWPNSDLHMDTSDVFGEIDVGSFLTTVESFHSDKIDSPESSLWYSLDTQLSSCTIILSNATKNLTLSSLPDASWRLTYSWNESSSIVHAKVAGVEGKFHEEEKHRKMLTPTSIVWQYSSNLLLAQTSHNLDIERYDPIFPGAKELTVYVYVVPNDYEFFQVLVNKYVCMMNNEDEDLGDVENQTPAFIGVIHTAKLTLPPRVCLMVLHDTLHFQKPLTYLLITNFEYERLEFNDVDEDQSTEKAKQAEEVLQNEFETTSFSKATCGVNIQAFNNIVRGWETLLESTHLKILHEIGPNRGTGFILYTKDSIQINLTEYFLNMVLEQCASTASDTVGIINYTGKSVRYFQPQPEASKRMIKYVDHLQSGALHSPPIVSVLFENRMLETTVENQNYLLVLFQNYDHSVDHLRQKLASNAAALTYSMSIQLFGFAWIHQVDLNQSGNYFFDLEPEEADLIKDSEDLDFQNTLSNPAIRAALRCLVGITKTRWGQCVSLQSQFEVCNATSFVLGIRVGHGKHHPVELIPQEKMYRVPLQRLYEYAKSSHGKHVGFIYLSRLPSGASVTTVEGEAMDLLLMMTDSKSSYFYSITNKINLCLEVSERTSIAERKGRWSFFSSTKDGRMALPRIQSNLTRIIVHPPLTLENTLCVNIVCCIFRYKVHLGKSVKDIVWEGTIKVGGNTQIYTPNLQDVLYLSILLPLLQCESLKPAVIHVPIVVTTKNHIKVDSIIELVEKKSKSASRTLKLKIENLVGGWLVVVARGLLLCMHHIGFQGCEERRKSIGEQLMRKCLFRDLNATTVCSDEPISEAHIEPNQQDLCMCSSPLCAGRRSARFATMFSFSSVAFEEVAAFANSLCIKCPKHSWSKGFSLEALGIDQVVEVKSASSVIPISVRISLGPDVFYRTKCVVFTPRFLIFNQLRSAIALYDAHDSLSMTMAPFDIQPFHPSAKLPPKKRQVVSVQYVLAKQNSLFRSGKFDVATSSELDVCIASVSDWKIPKFSCRDTKRGFLESKGNCGMLSQFVLSSLRIGKSIIVQHKNIPLEMIRVHSRFVGSSALTVFRPLTSINEVGYRIENQTSCHLLFYRQANVESALNTWQMLRPGNSALFTWVESLAPHQICICLRNEEAGHRLAQKSLWSSKHIPKKTILSIGKKKFDQTMHFSYLSSRTVVNERKGMGLEDVETISFDVIGLQVPVTKPVSRQTIDHTMSTASDEPIETKPSLANLHLNFHNPSLFQKPKRNTSYARVDGDGMTRVLRLRDSSTLDDEKSYFLKEEIRMQKMLTDMLSLQNTQIFESAIPVGGGDLSRRRSVELESVNIPSRPMENRSRTTRCSSHAELQQIQSSTSNEPSSIFTTTTATTSRQSTPTMQHPDKNKLRQLQERVLTFVPNPTFEDIHQVLITIRSAANLEPISNGDTSSLHPYCAITVLQNGGKVNVAPQKTYYLERTSNPTWHDQTFLFDLDGAQNDDVMVQLELMSHQAISSPTTLGSASLSLVDITTGGPIIKTLDIWRTTPKKKSVVGTLEIQIEVCRTIPQLLSHWYRLLRERIQATSENLVYVRARLNKIEKERVLESKRRLNDPLPSKTATKDKAKQILLKKKDKLVAQKNKLKVKWNQQLHHFQQHHMNDTLQTLKDVAEKRILNNVRKFNKSTRTTPIASLQRVKRLFSNRDGEAALPTAPLVNSMLRSAHHFYNPKQVHNAQIDYVTEIKAQYERSVCHGGTLILTILEGRGFNGKGDKIRCCITSEGNTYKTNKLRGENTMSWKPNIFEIPLRRRNGQAVIQVINVATGTSQTSLGSVNISIDMVAEYCTTKDAHLTGWFPLQFNKDTIPLEKDMERLVGADRASGARGYCTPSTTMCLNIQLQYNVSQTSFVVGSTVQYAILDIREIALSMSAHVYPIFSLSEAPSLEMQEVLRVSFEKVNALYVQSTKQQHYSFEVGSLQVDNQRSFSHQVGLPVVLSPANPANEPLLQCTIGLNFPKPLSSNEESLIHLEYMALHVQDIDLTFDEAILRTLYDILERLYDKHASLLTDFQPKKRSEVTKLYIARLEVSPFRANITFRKSYTANNRAPLRQHFKSKFAHSFAAGLVNVAKSIENAPLQFNALIIQHEITDLDHMSTIVLDHYTTSLLRQLYKLVGSMNFMGNPVGLAASVRDGLKDFVVSPYVGLARSGASGFVSGLTKGTLSLVGHTAFGVFDTTSRLTAAMGNSFATLSWDRSYNAKRNFFALARPSSRREQLCICKNKLEHDVGSGILGGIAGLFVDPIRGAYSGSRGFAVGMVKGVTGVVVKPVVGTIDMTTHVMEGLRDIAGLTFNNKQITEERQRKRIAHTFGNDGRLLPPDPVWNWAKALLVSFDPVSAPKLQVQIGDVCDQAQIVWTTAFKAAPGEYTMIVVRKGEVLSAAISSQHWQQPVLKWRITKDYVQGISLYKSGTSSRIVFFLNKPYKDPQVQISTLPWEDTRNFENDERKLHYLFDLLSRQYPVVGQQTQSNTANHEVSKLQQFAFERLFATQETLKTQYCLHPSDRETLVQSPWINLSEKKPLSPTKSNGDIRPSLQVNIL
ncbi:vacuolar associated sorting protein [Thraustotheca clavata]|uniref:Vacuolar associated sorting protein n=1 Tax=Thraustotheca clavata TaxID=74557 RepID=A0A1V9Y6R1_9STRA|nr:vacuolar associated sorting protein [Thraustotheca clavata]